MAKDQENGLSIVSLCCLCTTYKHRVIFPKAQHTGKLFCWVIFHIIIPMRGLGKLFLSISIEYRLYCPGSVYMQVHTALPWDVCNITLTF